jgi:hypothetical protein
MKILPLIASALFALPGMAYAQGAAGTGNGDDPPTAFRDTHDEIERNQLLDAPLSRKAMASFAACVAERDGEKARKLLVRDFRPASYRDALERLVRTNYDCMESTGHRSLGSSRLPFSAALAEELLERDATPLNARLARAAAGKSPETYTPSDAAALCLAKSVPDDVARLLATEPESEGETAAANALSPVLAACARAVGSPPIESTPFGLRSIVASAAFRLLAAQEAGA